ncbi:hypothetical protein ABIE44_000888 [Marmoricola sp. OAE513]|uniref:hypothetical protein n=1 Tax=Marmoricola sp. OAE513 TaxID=2817894 RepID=UPI001AE5D4AA
MSPLSGWVLGAATVVASPALWSTFVDGTMPMDVGLTRLLIAFPVSWLLISLVAELAFPAPGAVKPGDTAPEAAADGPVPDADPAEAA